MPFADKFRAMMDFPFPGETLGAFTVESVEVGHEGIAPGLYVYPVRMVMHGPGGVAGATKALKALFACHCTTFSGYGNPYQLWFGKPTVESLGEGRYAATVQGAGARIHVEDDLARFLEHLNEQGALAKGVGPDKRVALVASFLEGYRADIQRKVNRYRGRLRRMR